MKKIIESKLYNTDTANYLGTFENGHYSTDFQYCEEHLYKTKSEKFFLHGRGGAMSKYGVWCGNSGSSGEKIILMSEEQAKKWTEKHLSAREYEQIFGEVEEA